MAHTLHFLGTDLQHIRTFTDCTEAKSRQVDVYHTDMDVVHPKNDKIKNRYHIRITRRHENTEGDYYYYVLLSGPRFSKSFSGFLFPLIQKNAREYLVELLNEKVVEYVF